MRFVSAVVVALVLAVGLGAQSQQPDQQKPIFRTGVNYVRVDVYVTANGRPVTDLTKDDFDVQEDGVAQQVDTFERVAITAPGAETERSEPTSIEASNRAAANPRNRLFVLFLDSYHTSIDSTTATSSIGVPGAGRRSQVGRPDSRIGRALAAFLERTIGPDDLIAVTRPELPVDTVVFTRRPSSFEEMLMTGGEWQRRFVPQDYDDVEQEYLRCYPSEPDVAARMIARRRERMVIDGLRNLVLHLQGLREERKAILVVSEGWVLYKPDRTMMIPADGRVPGPPPIGVVGGQPTIGDPRGFGDRRACDRDRMMLADLDDERDFRRMLDDANRANATFYPIDPRGLPVFDAPPQGRGADIISDAGALRARQDALYTLASATDGIASINSNDFAKSFKRISDDLSTYYLLGYYSTNVKPDGKFHRINVHVKRPGVDVRARRGYNALTDAEAASRDKAAAPVDPETRSRDVALASLGAIEAIRPDRPLRLTAGYRWEAGDGSTVRPALWVAGELDPAAARQPAWAGGGEASITVTSAGGQTVATEKAMVTPPARTFVVQLSGASIEAGDYLVKARLVGKPGPDADANEQLRLVVPAASPAITMGQPIFYRRGPYSGAGFQLTADLRFRKAERLRVDVPLAAAADTVSARLLDRRGQPLQIPATAGQKEDKGVKYATAEVTLAPLAAADFLLEITAQRGDKTERTLAAFRIIP